MVFENFSWRAYYKANSNRYSNPRPTSIHTACWTRRLTHATAVNERAVNCENNDWLSTSFVDAPSAILRSRIWVLTFDPEKVFGSPFQPLGVRLNINSKLKATLNKRALQGVCRHPGLVKSVVILSCLALCSDSNKLIATCYFNLTIFLNVINHGKAMNRKRLPVWKVILTPEALRNQLGLTLTIHTLLRPDNDWLIHERISSCTVNRVSAISTWMLPACFYNMSYKCGRVTFYAQLSNICPRTHALGPRRRFVKKLFWCI